MKISQTNLPQPQKKPLKQVKKKQSSSWKGYLFKRGLAALALGVTLQTIYQSTLSPNSYDHQPEMGALQNFCTSNLGEADSLSFRAMQAFLNTFETWGYPYYLTGLTDSEPFGDLQAFALDGNLKALESAYSSYSEGQVNTEMLTELLGRVLRYMNLYDRDLKEVAKWLVKEGANVNHQQRVKRSEIAMGDETSHTTLMTAFHMLDSDLYSYLISKRATPAMYITSYSDITSRYDKQQTIFEAITDKMKNSFSSKDLSSQSQKRLKEAYLCPIYKSIVDDSLSVLPKSNPSFPDHDRLGVYLDLRTKICQDYFAVTSQEENAYKVEEKKRELKDKADSLHKKAKSIYDFFTTAEEVVNTAKDTFDDLSKEDFEEARNTFKKAEDIYKKTTETVDSAVSVASGIVNHPVVARVMRAVGNFAKDSLPVLGEAFGKTVNGLTYAVEQTTHGVVNIYQTDLTQKGLRLAYSGGENVVSFAIQGTKMTVNGLGTAVGKVGEVASSASKTKLAQGAAHLISGGARKGKELIVDGVSGTVGLVSRGAAGAAQLASDAGNSKVVQGALGVAGSAVNRGGELLADGVAGTADLVSRGAAGAAQLASDARNSKIVRGAIDAAGNAAGSIGDMTGNVVDELADRIEDVSNRKSSSSSGLSLK